MACVDTQWAKEEGYYDKSEGSEDFESASDTESYNINNILSTNTYSKFCGSYRNWWFTKIIY